MCVKKKKKPFPKLTVKIQEAYKLHSLQVEWEEWKRGDRLARTANERMQSLPFSLFLLLSLHHLYSLTLRQIWERALAYTRTQTQTNWAKPISRLDWTCFPAGRMTAEVIFLHLAVPAFDRSRTCLCSLSLAYLFLFSGFYDSRLHCTCDFIEIISLEAKHLCFPFKVTFWNLSYVSFGRDSK